MPGKVNLKRKLCVQSIVSLCVLMCSACSTPPPSKNEHLIRTLVPKQIRIRRPAGPGADPQAAPGGTEYRSEPLPGEQLDCEKPAVLFQNLKLPAVLECLTSFKEKKGTPPQGVSYFLKRAPRPFLYLDPKAKIPECVRQQLAQIAVPREIVFQARGNGTDGSLSCFTSRLPIEANQWMGAELPSQRFLLKIWLPLQNPPKDEEELVRLLTALAITPLWDEATQALKSKILPDAICKKCFGKEGLLRGNEPDLLFWPY